MSHKPHDIFESRKQFQLERLILFSDAVFAIAITLLVIEIKVPHLEASTQQALSAALLHKLPEFIAFAISFAVIGQFWTNHHRLFGYIQDYTQGLLWLNLHMLFWVALMPFSTYLNMEYGNLDVTWLWYCLNLTLIGFALYLIWRYISRHKHLCSTGNDALFMKYARLRAIIICGIFLAGGLLTLLPWVWVKWASRFVFFFIFPVFSLLRKSYERKNKKAAAM